MGLGAVGVWTSPAADETGGVKAGLAPGGPTGALEMVPSPVGLLGRSNTPFAAPGAVNLLLRSVDWPPAAAPPPGAIGAPPGWPLTLGAVGDEKPPVPAGTGDVVLGLGIDAPGAGAVGAPGLPTGALEMLPLPTGAFGASNAPFAAPGVPNLLLRSVDWPPAAAPPPGAIGAPPA